MEFEGAARRWKAIDAAGASRLAEVRLQAHWAAQVVAAVGEALVPAEADLSHTSMAWDDQREALLDRPVPESGPRVGLRLPALELMVLDGGLATRASFELERTTLSEALDSVVEALAHDGPAVVEIAADPLLI